MAQLLAILPWVALPLAALLLLYAILGDMLRLRFHRRRRCPKCWYDLSATPGRRCSECGFEAKTERKLFRFRRRWGLAIFALCLAVVGERALQAPAVQRHGWGALIPSTALMAILEVKDWPQPGAQEVVPMELSRRWRAYELWDWQEDLIRELALRRSVSCRTTWVEGVPWLWRFKCDPWLPRSYAPVSIRITDEGGRPIHTCLEFDFERDDDSFHFTTIDPGHLSTGMQLNCEIELSSYWSDLLTYPVDWPPNQVEAPTEFTWSHTLRIQLRPDIDDVITPVHSERLTRLIIEHFKPIPPTTMDRQYRFSCYVPRELWPDDVALTPDVRIYCDGELRVEDIASHGGPGHLPPVPNAHTLLERLDQHDLTQGQWTVKVSANPKAALFKTECDRYWAGEFELPLLDIPYLLAAAEAQRKETRRKQEALKHSRFGNPEERTISFPDWIKPEDRP